MSGMGGSHFELSNPMVVAIFHHSLLISTAVWILGIGMAILVIAILSNRTVTFNLSNEGLAEPRTRTFLRLGFGAFWLFAGILQMQSSMPLGLANDVVAPAAQGVPTWLHAIMFSAIGIWNQHPIALAVVTVWIQIALGILLLVSNAKVGRIAAAVSVLWAGQVWLIGNGAGGIFSSTSSILYGWPGAPLFYLVAGIWLTLDSALFLRHFSRVTTRFLSLVLSLGAVVQCLPNRGFWHGGSTNSLASMSTSMAKVSQPHWLAWVVVRSGNLAATLGGGFNLIVIFWLVGTSVGLWLSTSRPLQWPLRLFVVGAVLIWVVGQDLAVFGGLSTDINSMVPMAWLGWCAAPGRTADPVIRRLPREVRSSFGSVATAFAAAMLVVGLVNGVLSSFAGAENTLYLAQNGPASAVSGVAPKFSLTDQSGRSYSLGEHSGRFTLLAFLDPVCWTDCPLIANQLATVRSSLPANANLDIVAIAANPLHETFADIHHFIAVHSLSAVENFYFLASQNQAVMRRTWNSYGIEVQSVKTSIMSIHSDLLFIIGPDGQLKYIIPDNPLSNWSGQNSAVSELLSLLHQSGVR